MTVGQGWMVKILPRQTRHADGLHHAPRTLVSHGSVRNDFIEPEHFKPKVEGRIGTFPGKSFSPVFKGKPPANLDAGRKWHLITRRMETDESHEGSTARRFHRPQTVAVLFEIGG